MRTVAIYRLLYGSDFIGESLESVYEHVDRIYCFVTSEIFGGQRVVNYFGRDVYIPHDIDGVREAIARWCDENDAQNKVRIIDNPHGAELIGQVGKMVNECVLPEEPECTYLLFVECDEVWHPEQIGRLFVRARGSDADEMQVGSHLFWRSFRYVSGRENPYTVLRALNGRREMGETLHALSERDQSLRRVLLQDVKVHNFGYASSERTVFWKHIAALSFSRDLGLDSPPREAWFEEVWLGWDWTLNRRTDLCPSVGHEEAFAPAAPYPFDDLPPSMQRRALARPLPEWTAQGGAQACHMNPIHS